MADVRIGQVSLDRDFPSLDCFVPVYDTITVE